MHPQVHIVYEDIVARKQNSSSNNTFEPTPPVRPSPRALTERVNRADKQKLIKNIEKLEQVRVNSFMATFIL